MFLIQQCKAPIQYLQRKITSWIISKSIYIPLVAHGGAGNLNDIKDAINISGASAVGIGNMVVYQKKNMGVLINFPDKEKINE